MKRLRQIFLFTMSILWVVIVAVACNSAAQAIAAPTPAPSFEVNLPPTPLSAVAQIESEMEPVITTSGVTTFKWYGDNPEMGTPIDGTEATLIRMHHGIAMTFKTVDLTPGDAVTLWWVIFNRPENCSNGVCNFDDPFQVDENGQVLFDEAGVALENPAGREAIGFSLLRADGKVIETDGSAEFRGHLAIGDTTEAAVGPGLLDPMHAEIHLVAKSHGPAIPGNTHEQLNSNWGGCPAPYQAPCFELQFAGPFLPGQ